MTGGEKGINEGNRSLRLARGRLEQELFLKAVSGIGTVAGVCCAYGMRTYLCNHQGVKVGQSRTLRRLFWWQHEWIGSEETQTLSLVKAVAIAKQRRAMGRARLVGERAGLGVGTPGFHFSLCHRLSIKGAVFRQVRKLSLKPALCPSTNPRLFGRI